MRTSVGRRRGIWSSMRRTKKKNPNGLTEVAIADAQLEDEEDGKTECKCVVNNNNIYLKLALNIKKVHLEAFVRQHQSNPHIARLWLASKGFKTVLGQKVHPKLRLFISL